MDTMLLAELVVLTRRVDDLGARLHKIDPMTAELVMLAGDNLAEAGRILDTSFVYGELTACEACGCTVEDGECVCQS